MPDHMWATSYILEIQWHPCPSTRDLPRWVGPFTRYDDATAWADLNIPNGDWKVRQMWPP